MTPNWYCSSVLLACLLAIGGTGCVLSSDAALPPGAKPASAVAKSPVVTAKTSSKVSLESIVGIMYSRMDWSSSGVELKPAYGQAVKNGLSFLVKQFGPPLYDGRIQLVVTDNPRDNGKMSWSDKSTKNRVITLNDFNFIPSEQRVLVHELFHAFYQTNAFIKNNPDFINEGLAVYAENMFRYGGRSDNKTIAGVLQKQYRSLDPGVTMRNVDYDKPFSMYSSQKMDVMYLLAGEFIFKQFPRGNDPQRIREILVTGSAGQRMTFRQALSVYGFATDNGELDRAYKSMQLVPPTPLQ